MGGGGGGGGAAPAEVKKELWEGKVLEGGSAQSLKGISLSTELEVSLGAGRPPRNNGWSPWKLNLVYSPSLGHFPQP